MSNFFIAPELEPMGDRQLACTIPAMGYEYKAVCLYADLGDANLAEAYENNPSATIDKLNIPTFLNGFEMKALYDSEDGPIALYLKPISGLAAKVAELQSAIDSAVKYDNPLLSAEDWNLLKILSSKETAVVNPATA